VNEIPPGLDKEDQITLVSNPLHPALVKCLEAASILSFLPMARNPFFVQ